METPLFDSKSDNVDIQLVEFINLPNAINVLLSYLTTT